MIRFKLGQMIEQHQFQTGRRITIQEVATATGVNRMTLSKILNHKGYSSSTDVLDRLCAYFNCQVADLVEFVPTPSDATESTEQAQNGAKGS